MLAIPLPKVNTGSFVFNDRTAGLLKRDPPEEWDKWLTTLFPTFFTSPFADRQYEFWRWIEEIELGKDVVPFFAIWARGGAKTTSAEAGVIRLGAKGTRNFCLYVKRTQDKANESVGNISMMLETGEVARYYPGLAERKLGKYGHSKGWRVDTLRCATGFSVVGLGLDAASRGIKIGEFRPDLIVFDDVDEKSDSLLTVKKKIDTITTSILPAGSNDVAVLGIQNLMHNRSIFYQIKEGTAEFLYDRVVSGPYPAIDGLEYESRPGGGFKITGGVATWEGQDLDTCETQMNKWGSLAFLQEAQHEVDDELGGMWDHIEFRRCSLEDVPDLLRITLWVDPAVTDTDQSDSMAIQADGIDVVGDIYRLFSWEQRTSPEKAIRKATLKALEIGCTEVGIETDQGGDTWISVCKQAWYDLVKEKHPQVVYAGIDGETVVAPRPEFLSIKAGAGFGSKVHRNQQMLVDYENGRVIHVHGTHTQLERALKRFPLTKPHDLTDASFWSWKRLREPVSMVPGILIQRRTKGW